MVPAAPAGTALGIYGAGTGGGSLAAFGAPILAGSLGLAWGFWGLLYSPPSGCACGRPLAQRPDRPGQAADFARPLRERMSWVLSLYYFLTFGGFVAMAVYLPIFLTDMFGVTPRDAGLRTARFVVATGMRPVGGWLADRAGGERILQWVFPAVAVFAIFMACP